MSGTRIRQKFAKKRSLHGVNEHFSQIFNAIIVPRSNRAKVSFNVHDIALKLFYCCNMNDSGSYGHLPMHRAIVQQSFCAAKALIRKEGIMKTSLSTYLKISTFTIK
ncbi:hypothetical protein SAMN06296273_0673 [Nitrosomonas ureae]|uniref:Uncharacterized protein n=1 Tax=Nitrosomonas ureae TaxID=44577 RepID=A0A285BVG8_9PROT|nr:hypothetical protein [Nitrosomonas ureae]SNX59232.1 hypothetical protein SAMN06296273_0673 [Nitrosomonas ureae]